MGLLYPQKNPRLSYLNDSVIKCHLLVSTNNTVNIRVEHFDIENSYCQKLLGIKFDHKLICKSHSSDLRKKASKKVHGLARVTPTARKMKFSIKDFFSKCDQIRRKLRIWSHLLKKSLMENFIFCVVTIFKYLEKTYCYKRYF